MADGMMVDWRMRLQSLLAVTVWPGIRVPPTARIQLFLEHSCGVARTVPAKDKTRGRWNSIVLVECYS
jgi:hypothetical protein